jgi:hypothetical protein
MNYKTPDFSMIQKNYYKLHELLHLTIVNIIKVIIAYICLL